MAQLQMVAIVIVGLMLEMPRYFEQEIKEFTCDGETRFLAVGTDLLDNDVYWILYRTIISPGLRRYCPLVATSTLIFLMIRHIRRQNRVRVGLLAEPTLPNRRSQNNAKISPNELLTRVLAVVAFVYILCIFPSTVYPILRHILQDKSCLSFFNVFAVSSETLAVLNSALNFFIYYPSIPLFRECLKELFSKCICKKDKHKVFPSKTSINVVVTVVSRVELFPND